jgi:hypothetical protein
MDANPNVTHVQFQPRPSALGEALDAADDQVGAKPSDVTTEGRDRAVGRDEQGQDVKPIVGLVTEERRAWLYVAAHDVKDRAVRPGTAIDARLTRRVEHGALAKESGACPRRRDATVGSVDLDDAITGETGCGDLDPMQRFSCHRFHG